MYKWLFVFLFFSPLAAFEKVLESISERGYYEFENCELSAAWYDDLYRKFELFVEEYEQNASFRETLDRVDQEFGGSLEYGGYLMGMFLPERSMQLQLTYFRYCRGYRAFLESKAPELLEIPVLREFFSSYDALLEVADRYLLAAIEAIEWEGLPTSSVLLGNRKHLATALKIVRYESGLKSGLRFHRDISGWTLLMDHTDKGKEALVLAPHKKNLEPFEFVPPQRQFARGKTTSMLLIPGTALKRFGIPQEASPHGVLPLEEKRYAAIAFAMIPEKRKTP